VMLLATNLYTHGTALGLVLPFCLGLGMALPWPLAGGGLSMLPKPGAWMNKVKYGFGVVIALCRHEPLQIRHLAQQFHHQSFQLGSW